MSGVTAVLRIIHHPNNQISGGPFTLTYKLQSVGVPNKVTTRCILPVICCAKKKKGVACEVSTGEENSNKHAATPNQSMNDSYFITRKVRAKIKSSCILVPLRRTSSYANNLYLWLHENKDTFCT